MLRHLFYKYKSFNPAIRAQSSNICLKILLFETDDMYSYCVLKQMKKAKIYQALQ